MKIPFSNRTLDVELPNTQGQAKVTVKNIMEDFHRQTGDNFPKLFEAFVLLSPRKLSSYYLSHRTEYGRSVSSRSYVSRYSSNVQPGQDGQMGKHYAPELWDSQSSDC